MSRIIAFLALLCLLPYGYVGWYWVHRSWIAQTTVIDPHMLFYSFVLFVAAPFLLAFFGICSAALSAKAVKASLAERKPVQAATNSGFLWFSVVLAVVMGAASWRVYPILFPEVEEGRDRLGRICEKEGSVTRCRPDPEKQRSTHDYLFGDR